MPALNELTDEERDWLCDTIALALTEENTDEVKDLVMARLESVFGERAPWWARWSQATPLLPSPLDIVDRIIDEALPGLVRDPLLRLVECPNVD